MASFLHLCLLGFGGTIASEVVAENQRTMVTGRSTACFIILFAFTTALYIKVYNQKK